MQFIRHAFRRHRHQLKIAGWAALGFVLIFCVLTVQLSATEGRASRRVPTGNRVKLQPTVGRRLPAVLPRFAKSIETPETGLGAMTNDPGAFRVARAQQISHATSGKLSEFATGEFFSSDQAGVIIDHAPVADMGYIQQDAVSNPSYSASCPSDCYSDGQAMPRSNYFGVGPDDVRDEWSGFCDCEQNLFDRWCRSCGDKNFRARK